MRNIITTVFFICTLAVMSAFACVCVPVSGVKEELKEAGAVFSGKLIGKEYRKIANENGVVTSGIKSAVAGESKTLILKFQVENWWKGKSTKEFFIFTDQTKSSDGSETISDCDFPFEIGKRYLIYAYTDEGNLKTNICSRTKEIGKAREDLKLLGKGWKPKKR